MATDDLVEDMMLKYNKEKAVVFNTLQMYRWDRLPYLKELLKRAKQKGFKIGLKVVRGAYMEKENERAAELGYPTPICATKLATDINFDETVAYSIANLDVISIFSGTHNEESCYKLMELMDKNGIKKDNTWYAM